MSDTIIRVEGLGKKYSIHHEKRERYVALRDVVSNTASRLKQRLISPSQSNSQSQEDFWALQDVSFEVKQGDRIGIIGRNGAGKSTLLKILSRITEPTTGFVEIRGRVASLLEVGTGFHPELTGRENIYLNGAILGMGRTEIKQKFDEIVDFAEVDNFLDTPVKRYSSGMYVRLAFSIAAHLEPEVLIVDEVLAVGDIKFQRKCLGKMEDVGREGRTVIFVSHQTSALEALCNSGVVLSHGSVDFRGNINNAIQYYLSSLSSQDTIDVSRRKDRQGKGRARITKISIENQKGSSQSLVTGSRLKISLSYQLSKVMENPRLIVGIYDFMNSPVVRFDTETAGFEVEYLENEGTLVCWTDELILVPGLYRTNVAFINNSEMEDYVVNASSFEILSSDYFGTGKSFETKLASILVRHTWEAA